MGVVGSRELRVASRFMPANKSYEDLLVWVRAVDLSVEVCQLIRRFPKEEQYGLSSQLSRSAVSVPSNIAEGCARNSPREFLYFLGVARGSLAEVHTQLIIAQRLGYIDDSQFATLHGMVEETRKMVNGLKRSLEQRQKEYA